jgi:hypothetical protein
LTLQSKNLAPEAEAPHDPDMPPKGASGTLVIVELGAVWPAWLVESTPQGSCRVLAELEGEGPAAFADRVKSVSASLFPRGSELALIAVACNERTDEAAVAARREVALSLTARGSRTTRVAFAATEDAGVRLRNSLATLTASLDTGRLQRRVGVRLRSVGAPSSPRVARVA